MAVDIKSRIRLDAILKLSLIKKVLILVGINVVIAGLMYQFLISPVQDDVKELRGKLDELTVRLEESRLIARDIPRFLKEKEELEKKLKSALAQLPNEREIPDLIESISDAGKGSGLKILLFRPRPEVAKGFYAEVPIDMEVEGTYESLFNFCEKVSKFPRIVNIDGINVNHAAPDGFMSLAPRLRASFVVTTFRFIPDKEKDTVR